MLSKVIGVIKENPWKITLGTVATAIFTIAGVFFSDARYEFKSDAKKDKAEIILQIQDLQRQVNDLSKDK